MIHVKVPAPGGTTFQFPEVTHDERIAENETFAKTEFFPMVISEGQKANGEEEADSLQSFAFDLLSVTST